MVKTDKRCECGNRIEEVDSELCDCCAYAASQPPHKGRYSLFGGYWCDTCDSPYCELA